MSEQKETSRDNREQALRRRQAQRKKALRRRRRVLIASIAAIVVAAVLLVVFLVHSLGHHAEETALTLHQDGSVTFDEVLAFDSSEYDKSEMKKFVKDMVDSYNGTGEVTLESTSVSKGKAYVTIKYDSVATYAEFTGYNTFFGTIEEAKDAGYSFDLTFNSVADGHIGEAVTATEVVSDGDRQVLIVQENVVVNIPADIEFVTTSGISVRDKDTVEITPVGDNTDAAVAAYIIF